MKKASAVLAVMLCFSVWSAVALAANPQSDAVPTAQLWTSYSVVTGAGNQVTLAVTLVQVTVSNGQVAMTQVDQSADDVVTFTQGATSVVYNAAQPNSDVMPYVAGGTYEVTFKRFNGESYTSSVVVPDLATYSQPSAGQVFAKTDTVAIDWTSPAGLTPALMMLGTNCASASGDFTVNANYTSATVPAGFASPCTGAVQMEFDTVYETVGSGFGDIAGASIASVLFSYGATTPQQTIAAHTPVLLKRIARALRSHTKKLRYNF